MGNAGVQIIDVEAAEALSIDDIWKLYRSHVNSSQVELIGGFQFGRHLVDRAEGCYIFQRDGRRVLDITGGIGVLNHGHNHPEILAERIKFANRQRMEVHKNFFSPYIAALSANVARMLPRDLAISYFPNSGAEAVEGALKMAYKFHGGSRSTVLHSNISFHGKLLGAASLTGSPELHFEFPRIPGVDSFDYGDTHSLENAMKRHVKDNGESDVYAVIVEPLNASSMRQLSDEALTAIREICDRAGAILIFDEVYTGWGKTGFLFNFMRVPDLCPDIVTYAKSFGGGKSSIAGYTAREPIARQAYDNLLDATLHSTTYYGFGEEAATAIRALEILVRDDYVQRAAHLGNLLGPRLRRLQEKHTIVSDVRGSGALWGLVLESKMANLAAAVAGRVPAFRSVKSDRQLGNKLVAAAVISHLYEHHNILTYFGSNIENPLIVSLPLIAADHHVEDVVSALDATLECGILELASQFARTRFQGPKAQDG